MKRKVFTTILFAFCIMMLTSPITVSAMSDVHITKNGGKITASENGKDAEELKKNATDSSGKSGMKHLSSKVANFYTKYKIVLKFVLIIATLTCLLAFIILFIQMTYLGDNHWILRRRIQVGLIVCAICTAVLGSITTWLGVFYGLFR